MNRNDFELLNKNVFNSCSLGTLFPNKYTTNGFTWNFYYEYTKRIHGVALNKFDEAA